MPRGRPRKYNTEEERQEAKREAIRRGVKKYEQSEKGKTKRKKWSQSEKGKEAIGRGVKKYLSTEKGKTKRKKWSQSEKGRETIKRGGKKYAQSEKGKLNRKKINRRQRETPERKIVNNLRHYLRSILKEENLNKTIKFNTILGCTGKELKDYLENQFNKKPNTMGMSWDNYGKWEIDHIKSVNYFLKNFDFNNPEVQKKCFHFSNLQPLWKLDNIKKSNKVIK